MSNRKVRKKEWQARQRETRWQREREKREWQREREKREREIERVTEKGKRNSECESTWEKMREREKRSEIQEPSRESNREIAKHEWWWKLWWVWFSVVYSGIRLFSYCESRDDFFTFLEICCVGMQELPPLPCAIPGTATDPSAAESKNNPLVAPGGNSATRGIAFRRGTSAQGIDQIRYVGALRLVEGYAPPSSCR